MKNKRSLFIILGAVVLALLVSAGFLNGFRKATRLSAFQAMRAYIDVKVHAQSPANAYTVVMTEYLTSGPASPLSTPRRHEAVGRHVVALRADGSTSDIFSNFGHDDGTGKKVQAWDERSVIDISARRGMFVQQYLNAMSSHPLSDVEVQRALARGLDPEADCLVTRSTRAAILGDAQLLGRETILGYSTVVVGTAIRKNWMAPALRCAIVKSEYLFLNSSGVLVSKEEQIPDSIVEGNPDPLLFAASGDELKPSDIYRRKMQLWGLEERYWNNSLATLQAQDAGYLAAQSH
jgi:hypothetical protein